jgi:heme A synthase
VLAGYLMAGTQFTHINWAVALSASAVAALLSVLQSVIDAPDVTTHWVLNFGVRAVRTFAQSAVGGIGAAVLLSDIDFATVAATAGYAALVSVVMSLLTMTVGPSGTPEIVDPPGRHALPDAA